jgi:hypothetical protein
MYCEWSTDVVANVPEMISTFFNTSNNQVYRFTDSGQVYAVINSVANPRFDYLASSFGASTQCELITEDCNLVASVEEDPGQFIGNNVLDFHCNRVNYTGTLSEPDAHFNIQFHVSPD